MWTYFLKSKTELFLGCTLFSASPSLNTQNTDITSSVNAVENIELTIDIAGSRDITDYYDDNRIVIRYKSRTVIGPKQEITLTIVK